MMRNYNNIELSIMESESGISIEDVNRLKSIINSVNNFMIDTIKEENISQNTFQVLVLLTNDEKMLEYNRELRGISSTTNVLSLQFYSESELKTIMSSCVYIGEIYISIPTALKESKEQAIRFEEHVTRLFVHGMLHLFGFNHKTNEQALIMYNKENNILNKFFKSRRISGLVENFWKYGNESL